MIVGEDVGRQSRARGQTSAVIAPTIWQAGGDYSYFTLRAFSTRWRFDRFADILDRRPPNGRTPAVFVPGMARRRKGRGRCVELKYPSQAQPKGG